MQVKLKKVRGEFDKSMSEFYSYVSTVFKKQDSSMTKLQEECRITNEEMVKWREVFSEDVRGLKSNIVAIMNAVGAGSNPAAQYGVPETMAAGPSSTNQANIITESPLEGNKSDTFTGITVQERARQIRQAEITAQKTFELERINKMNNSNNNVDLAMSLIGNSPQK